MIIILEGPDGVGKSTLAQMLSARLNVPTWKRKHNPLYGMSTAMSQQLHESELSLLKEWPGDIVVDRFVPSEIAYNKAFDRAFNERRAYEICKELSLSCNVIFVYMYWPSDATREEIEARTDDEVSVDKIYEVQRYYDKLFEQVYSMRLNCLRDVRLQVESVMKEVAKRRPSLDRIYMNLALEACRRSTCLSRRTGAVLVSARGHVIATGFNGAPCGIAHQESCPRLHGEIISGSGLDECNDVHAEENALLQAGLSGSTPEGGTIYTVNSPCHRCARMLINAKIKEVVYLKLYGDTRAIELFKEAGIKMREMTA